MRLDSTLAMPHIVLAFFSPSFFSWVVAVNADITDARRAPGAFCLHATRKESTIAAVG
jgi:hypothetical protein